jgi:hypothetical protein
MQATPQSAAQWLTHGYLTNVVPDICKVAVIRHGKGTFKTA